MKKISVKIDPRIAKQDAKNAVRNPLDALIELVTNSMDSYNRMKGRGETLPADIDGKIHLYLSLQGSGKNRKSVIACKDWAEGIDDKKMEEYISGYGSRTSGKETFQSIRGFFGRGLQDAAAGLDGLGRIYSVKNDKISMGVIDGRDKNKITYEPVKVYNKSDEVLKEFHLDDDSKTLAMVEFPADSRSIPKFDTYREKLTLCVQLRPLMTSGKIELFQFDKGKMKKRKQLKYNPPKGELIYEEYDIPFGKENEIFDMKLFKCSEELTQGEARKYREGGLLIKSGTSVHEQTLLKFERDPNATKFRGEIQCDFIDELMRKDELVVTPDRQGLNWSHPKMNQLQIEIEKIMQPFVDKEKKDREKFKKGHSDSTLKRNELVGKKLGKLYEEILKTEKGLGTMGGTGTGDKDTIMKPSMGFGFIPRYYVLETKKKGQIRLLIESPRIFPSYEKVFLECDNKNIKLEKCEISIGDGEQNEELGIFIHRIGIFSDKPQEPTIIRAHTIDKNGNEAVTHVKVVVIDYDKYPQNGFAFVPDDYKCKVEKSKKLLLKIDGEIIPKNGIKIEVSSDNEYIVVEEPNYSVQPSNEVIDVGIRISGNRTGEIGQITAIDIDNRTRFATANVKVVSTNPPPTPKGFNITYEDTVHVIQRSLCKDNNIYIYVNEPTVKHYYGENGEYEDLLSFQILCADLITDAFCDKLIEELSPTMVFLEDIETELRRKRHGLKRKVGPVIHRTYVDSTLLKRERNHRVG